MVLSHNVEKWFLYTYFKPNMVIARRAYQPALLEIVLLCKLSIHLIPQYSGFVLCASNNAAIKLYINKYLLSYYFQHRKNPEHKISEAYCENLWLLKFVVASAL